MSKTETKRERILEAAIEVFSKVGYHNAKITKIAEMSNVAAGSVYLYFANKEHLLEEVFVRSWSKIEARLMELDGAQELSNKEKISQLVEFIVMLVFESKNIASMILHEHRFWSSGSNKRLNDIVSNSISIFKKIIMDGMKSEEFRNDLMPSLTTAYFIGGLWHQLAYWADNFDDYTIDIVKNQAVNLVLKSLS